MHLTIILHKAYSSNIEEWFQDLVSTEGITNPIGNCWQNGVDSKTSPCTRKWKDVTNLVVSLPVIFILKVSEPQNLLSADLGHWKTLVWDFLETLLSSTKQMANEVGLIYNLVSLALLSLEESHFVTHYISKDHSAIFDYDGMQLVLMAKAPGAFATCQHGEVAGMGTWQMVARLSRYKNSISMSSELIKSTTELLWNSS